MSNTLRLVSFSDQWNLIIYLRDFRKYSDPPLIAQISLTDRTPQSTSGWRNASTDFNTRIQCSKVFFSTHTVVFSFRENPMNREQSECHSYWLLNQCFTRQKIRKKSMMSLVPTEYQKYRYFVNTTWMKVIGYLGAYWKGITLVRFVVRRQEWIAVGKNSTFQSVVLARGFHLIISCLADLHLNHHEIEYLYPMAMDSHDVGFKCSGLLTFWFHRILRWYMCHI